MLSFPPPPYIRLGSHPELLHLHSELSRRRDKRIELAARRRSYEIANILKRRRTEESAVWSWWMVRFFPSSL
jgi:Sds3-like